MQNPDTVPSNFKNGLIDFTAGSLGGVAVVYVGQPLDTVKVKMQTFPHLYKGMYDCLKQTWRNDGIIRGLYAGTTPAILANVAENSVLFCAYGFCQKLVCAMSDVPRPEELTMLGNASAGFLAAFFSSFTLCPTELIKCQLQAMREVNWLATQTVSRRKEIAETAALTLRERTPKSPAADTETGVVIDAEVPVESAEKAIQTEAPVNMSPWQLTKQIVREHGIPGLFRGLVPTIMREMPGYFFFFGGYEGTRELLKKPGQTKEEIGFIKTMIAGAVGGLVLWIVIFPTDVIKSRVQISNKKLKFLAVGYEIIQKEGVLALYNGLKPGLLRTIPATAALFVVYEYSKKLMHTSFGD